MQLYINNRNAYLICRSVSQFRDAHLRSCAPVQHSYLLRVIARVALSFLTASDLIGAEIEPIDPVQRLETMILRAP